MADSATQSADREVTAAEMQRLHSARTQTLQSLASLKDRVEEDVLAVPHEKPFGGEAFKTKSTVGIMLIATSIDNMVVGGPAYNCQKLDKGDMILKIDGTAVTRDNVSSLLVGSDIPGSTVTLTVKKGFSNVIDVVLARMATEVIADKRRLFELFTDMKEEAPTAGMSSKVDSVISLWTKMTIAEAQHQRRIADGIKRMQTDCSKQIDAIAKSLDELQVRLKELPSASTPKMLGVGLILEQQRDPGGRFVYIVGKCVPGSPAHRCGMIFEGDVLHSVSGTSVSVLSNDEMASLITGPEGSKVQLTFERNTLSTSRSKLTTVELERGSALDASSEIVGTVDRLQAEALLLKGDMDDLHAQLDEVDESRGQYRQQVIDITEQRGKVERDLLYAKQEAEKCYMAAIGRANEARIPPQVVDMRITELSRETQTRLIDLEAKARISAEETMRISQQLQDRQAMLVGVTDERNKAYDELRSMETVIERLRSEGVELSRAAMAAQENAVHQAEMAAAEKLRKCEDEWGERARRLVASVQAEADKVKLASKLSVQGAESRANTAERAMEEAASARDAAFKSAKEAAQLSQLVGANNLALRLQLAATLEALSATHCSLCQPRGPPLGGLGLKLTVAENGAVVDGLVEGGSAMESGKISEGDVVLKMDGQKLAGMPIDKIRGMVLGPACTPIELTIAGHGSGDERTLTLVRSGAEDAKGGDVGKYVGMLSKEAIDEVARLKAAMGALAVELNTTKTGAEKAADAAKKAAEEEKKKLADTKDELKAAREEHSVCAEEKKAVEASLGAEEGRAMALRDEVARLQELVSKLQPELETKKARVDEAEKEIEHHIGKNDELVIRNDRLEADIKRLTKELEDALHEAEVMSRKLGGGDKEVERLNGEVGRLRKEIKDHPREIADAISAKQEAAARAERAAAVLASSEQALAKERKALENSQAVVQQTKGELEKERQKVKDANLRSAGAESEAKAAKDECLAYQKRLGTAVQELEKVTKSMAAMASALDASKKDVEAALASKEVALGRASTVEKSLIASESAAATLKSEVSSAKALLADARNEEARLKIIIGDLQKRVQTLSDVEEGNRGLTVEIERLKGVQAAVKDELSGSRKKVLETEEKVKKLSKELEAANSSHHELAMELACALEPGRALVSSMFGPEACEMEGGIGITIKGDGGKVASVDKNGPSGRVLAVGDILLSANGREVTSVKGDHVGKMLLNGQNGTPLTLNFTCGQTGLNKVATVVRSAPGQKHSVRELVGLAVTKATEVAAELDGARSQMHAHKVMLGEKERDIKAMNTDKRAAEEQHKTFQEKIAELISVKARLTDACKDMEAKHKKREEELVNDMRFSAQKAGASLAAAEQQLKDALRQHESERTQLQARIADKDKAAEKATETVKGLVAEVEKRTASEDKLKQEASKLSSELEAAKAVVKAGENEIRDLREVCQSLRGELSDLRKSSGVLQEQYTGTREELGTTLGRMQALEDAVAEKHALAKDRELLKLDLQSASFRIETLERELAETKASLGKVSTDLESSAKLLAELTEASNKKVTSLEADIAKLKGELESSRASVKQQADQIAAARKELASASQNVADRSAQCTRLEASLDKKSTEANALIASEKSLREELSSTSKEKDALTEQRDELLHRVTELANQLEKASEEIKKISSELREDKAALKETKELLDAKMVHLDNSKARAVQLDKALAVAVKEIEVTRGDLDKAVQEAEGLTGSLKASQATLASEKAVNNQLSDEVRVLSERMLQFQNELTAEREFNEKLQRDMESAHKEITRLNGDAKRLTKEIKDHPVEVATMKAAIQDAGSRADKFKREAESERRLCGAARKETEAEREAKEATALKLKEAEDEADKFRRDFEGERAAKELAEMDLSSVRVELDAEKEANKRMNELMVELLEMRDMFPKMESDRDKAIADADSTKASLMKLKDDTMKMIKSVEDKAKEELDAAVVSLENMTNSERAARQSIRNLTTALEDAKNQIVKEDEKLAQSLKREQETSDILSATQDELEELRVIIHEERARYDELAILSEGYQMEAVVARETHMECAEKLRTMCTASIKMHDAICHLEGATVDQGGVGIKIAETTSGTLIVDNLLREGAAEKTGKIFVGDALLSINGVSTEKMTVEEAREQIVGDVGLPVTLEVQQQNARKTRCTVTIFRGLRGGKDDVIAQMVEDAVSAARERHDEIGELREELRTILPKTRAQVDDMATILETYKAQAEKEKVAARQEITETLSRNIELERLLEISRAETAERDATIVELQTEIARLLAEEAALRAEIVKLAAERDEAWRNIKTLRGEVAALEKTVAGLKEDAVRRQKENEEAFTRNSLLNKEVEATKKTLDKALKENEDLRVKLSSVEAELKEAKARIVELEARVAELEKLLREANARIEALEKEYKARIEALEKEYKARIGALEKELEGVRKERDVLKAEVQRLQKELEETVQRLEKAHKAEVAKLNKMIGDLEERVIKEVQALEDKIRALEKEKASLVQQRDAMRQERDKAVAEYNSIKIAYVKALADVQRLIEAVKPLQQNVSGGLGMKLMRTDESGVEGPVVVNRLLQGGVAQASGQVDEGDIIAEVDGKSLKGLEMDKVMSLVLGKPGSKVMLRGERGDSGRKFNIELVRSGALVKGEDEVDGSCQICRTVDGVIKALKEEVAFLKESEGRLEQMLEERGRARAPLSKQVSAQT